MSMDVSIDQNQKQKHVCKPDDVATFQLLKNDTKACPACATPIYRTEGCSQMFCTQCNVVWDWNTLKIEENENLMHNPYYYEWRAGGGVHGEVGAAAAGGGGVGAGARPECAQQGQNVGFQELNTMMMINTPSMSPYDCMFVLDAFRALAHVRMVELSRVTLRTVRTFEKNVDLRIRYLKNDIDDKRFKTLVQMREKAENKKKEIWQILSAFHLVGQDLIGELVRRNMDAQSYLDFNGNFVQLLDYSTEALGGVAKRYECKIPDLPRIMYNLD
jgi:hypothetical protein